MRATNLLPKPAAEPKPHPAPATVCKPVEPPHAFALVMAAHLRKVSSESFLSIRERAERQIAEDEAAREAKHGTLSPPEPVGLVPPEPKTWHRESVFHTAWMAQRAEAVKESRTRFDDHERKRLEQMRIASSAGLIVHAMKQALAACNADESIFHRAACKGTRRTYSRCPDQVIARRRVWRHMHAAGVSWSDIARLFGVAHSVIMSCRFEVKGLTNRSK